MGKILLKHVGQANSSYQRDVEKIARVTITVKSISTPRMEIYSSEELSKNGYHLGKTGTTCRRKLKTVK